MRKVKLYIAISLDGKIARMNGNVDWLDKVPNPEKADYGYAEFYHSIDTVLMGHNTYKKIQDFGVTFPYKSKSSYVFTKDTTLQKDENVSFVSENIIPFIAELKKKEGRDIWLVGGSQMIDFLANEKLIDEVIIFVMPVMIGEGIVLSQVLEKDVKLKLIENRSYGNGLVELRYELEGRA